MNARRYAYDGNDAPMDLVRTRAEVDYNESDSLGWELCVTTHGDFTTCRGQHLTMVTEPHVTVLAEMVDAKSPARTGRPRGAGVTSVLACPGEDEVHLWQAPLDLDPIELAALESFLSTDERERAERFRVDRDGARYTAARGWLRWLIGQYLDADPGRLSFSKGAFGKPELTDPAVSWLRFNVAHSADLAVFAIAARREIGVDIERIRADFPVDAVAHRFLSSEERLALAAHPPGRRSEAFFDLWARKEAYLKAIGVGLGATNTDSGAHGDRGVGWLLTAFDAGAGYAAAVAVEGRSVRVPAASQPLRTSRLSNGDRSAQA